MTVEQIIKDYLEKNKLDGLCSDDRECACLKDNLAPCGNLGLDCVPGIKAECDEDCDPDYYGPCTFHIKAVGILRRKNEKTL